MEVRRGSPLIAVRQIREGWSAPKQKMWRQDSRHVQDAISIKNSELLKVCRRRRRYYYDLTGAAFAEEGCRFES